MQALDQAGGEVVAVEVAAELLLDAGAQDLDGDLAPAPVGVDDGGLVHLRDRGRGDGGPELGEMIFELAAERFLDGAARLGHGERRQVVLQQRQLAGELGTDDVGARRQELAELDVAGAEAGQGGGEARAARLAGAERRRQQGDRRDGDPGEAQRQRHRRARRHEADAVLRQHEAGLGQPQGVGDRSGHRRGFVLHSVRRSAGGRLRRSRPGQGSYRRRVSRSPPSA